MDYSFDFLKKACWPTVVSFKDLQIGDYLVTEFKLVETKNFGLRLTVILEGRQVFLPKRFAKDITPEIVADLNKTPKIMSYIGRDEKRMNMVILDFKSVNINELATVNTISLKHPLDDDVADILDAVNPVSLVQQLDEDDADLLAFIENHGGDLLDKKE